MKDEYYQLVPKELNANLEFRSKLVRMGSKDPRAAKDIWMMCKRSILFYINAFCYLHEPRTKRSRSAVIPFITWDFQDEAITEISTAIREGYDLCLYKSRDMGASWMNLICIEHPWHFRDELAFGLLSRNENYVDDPGNMKALFQKIDFIHERLPKFLMPPTRRVSMHIENLETGSTIDGESTTGRAMRGDRRTAILLDEFDAFETADGFKSLGSTQFATDCRLFNSTFESTAGAFYAVYKNAEIKKLQLPWWNHPLYQQGMYFDANGKRRSPWYDMQCAKASDQRIIARELDMNPEGAQSQFFAQSEIEIIIRDKARKPLYEGEMDFDGDTALNPVFIPRLNGRVKLWVGLDGEGKPAIQNQQFSLGADIATGTGSSNSALSGTNRENGIKILEFADSHLRPDQFARIAVAIARWLNNALLVPEANGPGRNFIDAVLNDLHYGNMYFRENIRAIDKKRTLNPGWQSTSEAKWELFGEYRRALVTGGFTNPSERALKECLDYVFFANTIWHIAAVQNDDPSSARDNHGDIATADALSWKGVRYSPASKDSVPSLVIPPNSIAGRRAWHEKRKRERELAWH